MKLFSIFSMLVLGLGKGRMFRHIADETILAQGACGEGALRVDLSFDVGVCEFPGIAKA